MSVAGDVVTAPADRRSNPGLKQWDGSAHPNLALAQFDIDCHQFLGGIEIIQMFSVLASQGHRAASQRDLVLAVPGRKLGDVNLRPVGFVGLIRHPATGWRNPRIPGAPISWPFVSAAVGTAKKCRNSSYVPSIKCTSMSVRLYFCKRCYTSQQDGAISATFLRKTSHTS